MALIHKKSSSDAKNYWISTVINWQTRIISYYAKLPHLCKLGLFLKRSIIIFAFFKIGNFYLAINLPILVLEYFEH